MPCATLLRVDAVFAQRLVKRYCHPNCRIAGSQSIVASACVDYLLENTITATNVCKTKRHICLNNSQKQPLCLRRFVTNKKSYKNEVKHLSHYNGTQDNRLIAIPHAWRHLLANVGILRNHNQLLDRLSLGTDIHRHQVST